MRKFVIFFHVFAIVTIVCGGSVRKDSVRVFFALNKAAYSPTSDKDSLSMERFIDGIVMIANKGKVDSVTVRGYASPDGPFSTNERLSIQRCNALAGYISLHTGIPLADIKTTPGGVAWEDLRVLVNKNANTPCREAVLQILDSYLPDACTNQAKSDKCMKSLVAIDNGRTYRWMLENLFPELRFAFAVFVYTTVSETEQPAPQKEEDADSVAVVTIPEDTEEIEIVLETDSLEGGSDVNLIPDYNSTDCTPLHKLAIKTNLLYYPILLPNIEVEWRINDKWSVALEGDVAWWGRYSKNESYRLAIVSPEVKRWFRTRGPWHGFNVGLFGGVGLYDLLRHHKDGYRGEGAMAGVSAGYMWPVGRNLSLEGTVGVGYMYTRYKEYIPLDGHHVYQRTKNLNHFGPLKAKLSLVWRLWDVNKSNRQNAEKQTKVQYEK